MSIREWDIPYEELRFTNSIANIAISKKKTKKTLPYQKKETLP